MPELTAQQRSEIIKRRGYRDDITKKKHPAKVLEIHHKNRNPNDNKPTNLRVLTKEQHKALHERAGR